jgi:hypothetical protein
MVVRSKSTAGVEVLVLYWYMTMVNLRVVPLCEDDPWASTPHVMRIDILMGVMEIKYGDRSPNAIAVIRESEGQGPAPSTSTLLTESAHTL